MSRAFVKEPDAGEPEELFERPISEHQNFVTPEGLAAIETALAQAEAEHAASITADDATAIARAGRDMRYWTARRGTAEVVPPPEDDSQVRFGSTVTIERDDGRHTYRIVGEDEADPAHGTIAYVAPLARALTGKEIGDVVKVGDSEAEIIAIK